MVDIGVVILNYNTWEKTIECVESLNNFGLFQKYAIVIVDNCSTNDSFQYLNSFIKSNGIAVDIVETPFNGGFSYGNNFGFEFLMHKMPYIKKVLFTNNDIVFNGETIEELSTQLVDDVLAVGPKILSIKYEEVNNPLMKSVGFFNALGLIPCKTLMWANIKNVMEVYMVSGCCLMFDAEKFSAIGMFDEHVFLYNEENIIAQKACLNDFKIKAVPSATVIHAHGFTTGSQNLFVDKNYLISSLYYFRRYRNKGFLYLKLFRAFMLLKCKLKGIMGKYISFNKQDFVTMKIESNAKIDELRKSPEMKYK